MCRLLSHFIQVNENWNEDGDDYYDYDEND